MELLGCVCALGFLALIVGAIMGMVAKNRTDQLLRRLDSVERKLAELRAERRREAPAPAADAEPAPMAPREPTPAAIWPVPEAAEAEALPPAEPVPMPAVEPEPLAPANAAREVVDALAAAPWPTETPAAAEPEAPPPPLPTTPAPRRRDDSTNQNDHFAGVEQALGMRWLTWIGVGLLFLGVAFFLKYAYDRDWLGNLFGPRLRIATAAAAALGLATCGWRSLRNGMQALGQGLLGGGQALLYLTIFAAFQPAALVVDEPLLGQTSAFALMVLVTAAGLALAVRLDAIAMAFLAVLGGFATPILIHGDRDARDLLCAYLLLLDLGVLLVASYRRWRALDLLAFAGTVVLFGGWFAAWHQLHPQPDATLLWLGAFHLVFVLLPIAHHWRHRTVVTVERFALALANVAWSLAYATWMLRDAAPRLLAALHFVGALLYLALGIATSRRVGDDRRTRDGFLALATLLLTLGLFQALPANATTTGWFAEAAVLLWLGHRHAHRTTRRAALVVLALAMLRTLVVHLPRADLGAALGWNPWFVTLLVASLGLAAFAAVHHRFATDASERRLGRACGIGAGLWALLVGSLEILRHAEGSPADWTRVTPALAVAWLQLVGALAFLQSAARRRAPTTFLAAFLPLLAGALATAIAYDRYPADAWPLANGCCLTGLALVGTLALAGRWSANVWPQPAFAASLFGLAQLALSALATIEAAAWLQRGDAQPAPGTIGQVLGWVWLGSAASGSLAAAAWSSRRTLVLAAIPLALAALAAFWQFGTALAPHRLIGNSRFLFAALLCTTLAAWRPLLRRLLATNAADHASATALALLLLYASCESVAWSHATQTGAASTSWIVWLFGATAVAGAAGGGFRAHRTGNRSLRGVALVALAAALLLPLMAYLTRWDAAWMFANLRAALVAAAVATATQWARVDARLHGLRWIAFAVALVGLTVEPPTWLLAHVQERAEAVRLALFSVTVVWIVIAPVLLVVGFRRDQRPVRLVALALFAATAAKLLLLDMSGAQQLYRILAFVLVGLVFVGASWLYHRVERRLAGRP